MKHQRFDVGSLSSPRERTNGFLEVDAFLTRTGVFPYRMADGSTRRELRLPEEVFNGDSLDSFKMTTVTMGHPMEPVTAKNARKLGIGSVGQDVRQDADKVRATLMFTDDAAINTAKRFNRQQISCGYFCDLEMTSGITEDGEEYDAIQRNIRGNHVALVDRGRAGPEVLARLDSADGDTDIAMMITDDLKADNPYSIVSRDGKFAVVKDADDRVMGTHDTREEALAQLRALEASEDERGDADNESTTYVDDGEKPFVTSSNVTTDVDSDFDGQENQPQHQRERGEGERLMQFKLNIDGVDFAYEADEPAKQALEKHLGRFDEAMAQADVKIEEAEKARDEAVAKADAADEKVEDLEKARKDAEDPEKIKALVKARVDLEKDGEKVLGDKFNADASDDEIKKAVIQAVSPNADLDGKSEAYVEARYDAAMEVFVAKSDEEAKATEKLGEVRKAAEKADSSEEKPLQVRLDEARQKMIERNREAFKKPVGTSKDAPAA